VIAVQSVGHYGAYAPSISVVLGMMWNNDEDQDDRAYAGDLSRLLAEMDSLTVTALSGCRLAA